MIKTKFTKLVYFYTFLILTFPIICTYFIIKINQFSDGNWHWGAILVAGFLLLISLLVVIWGLFVEMNMRMSVAKLDEKQIQIALLLGIGTKWQYDWTQLDGFVGKKFYNKGKTQEYLYLLKDKKPVVVFSSMYLQNYEEIRRFFEQKLKEYS